MAEAVIDEKKAAKTPAALAALAKALVEATQRIDAAKEFRWKARGEWRPTLIRSRAS